MACATGGEYLYLASADEFTQSYVLLQTLGNMVYGAWKLDVRTDLANPAFEANDNGYLLSTQLYVEVTAGTSVRQRSASLEARRDFTGYPPDSRLWLKKNRD